MQTHPIAMETTGARPGRGLGPHGRPPESQAAAGMTFAEMMSHGNDMETPSANRSAADGAAAVAHETPSPDIETASGEPTEGDPSAFTALLAPPAAATVAAAPVTLALATDVLPGNTGAPGASQTSLVVNSASNAAATGQDSSVQASAGASGPVPASPAGDMLAATVGADEIKPAMAPLADPPAMAPVASATLTASAAPALSQPAGDAATATAKAPGPGANTDGATALKPGHGGDGQPGPSAPLAATAAMAATVPPPAPAMGSAMPGGANGKPQPIELPSAEPDAAAPAAHQPAHTPSSITPPTPAPSPPPAAATAGPVAGGAAGEPAPQPAAEQVSVHLAKAVKAGLDRIEIQLSPASLGRIEIRLDITDKHHVSASLAADSRDTLDLLKADVRLLERVLHDAGLKTDSGSLSFHLRDQGARSGRDGEKRREAKAPAGVGAEEMGILRPATLAAAMSATTPGRGIDIHA